MSSARWCWRSFRPLRWYRSGCCWASYACHRLLVRGFPKIPRKQFLQVLGVGFVGYGISLSLQFLGHQVIHRREWLTGHLCHPGLCAVFASLLLRERITPLRLTALALATLGVIAVIDPRSAQLNPESVPGEPPLLGAADHLGALLRLVRKTTQNLDVLPFSLIAFLRRIAGHAACGRLGAGDAGSRRDHVSA